MKRGALLSLLSLLLLVAVPQHAWAAGATVAFPFADDTLLLPRQSNGGAAYLPDGLDGSRPAPVVVFLHGKNEPQIMHPRMRDGDGDLRELAANLVSTGRVEPFVLAAPTHTSAPQAAETVFPDFDLDAFLDATERAVSDSARIDRSRIVVVAHSAGGCNPTGGLLRVAKGASEVKPIALVAADTCLGSYVSDALRQAAPSTTVYVYWQTWMWTRTFDAFRQSFCDGTRRCEELKGLTTLEAHDKALDEAFTRALPLILPARP